MNLTMDQIEITRLSSRGQVVIPIEMRGDLKEGDKLLIIRRGDEIILKKTKEIISEITLISENSLANEWLTPEEDEAWKDL